MKARKIFKALVKPPLALALVLIPVSAFLLALAFSKGDEGSAFAIGSYVASAYTLTVWCVKMPHLVRLLKRFKNENGLALRWQRDERLRVNVSLYGALIGNVAYALLNLWLGLYHKSFWFYSLAGYYVILALVRFLLLRHTRTHGACENMREQLLKYRTCGWTLLSLNLLLSLVVFFMIYWGRTFEHDEITTIMMAAYTFASLTFAIINIVKYRKYNSPVYSASMAIGLAAAAVSMLTLESTMLSTFGGETTDARFVSTMLGATGAAVSAVILAMAVYMIADGTKKLKTLKERQNNAKP